MKLWEAKWVALSKVFTPNKNVASNYNCCVSTMPQRRLTRFPLIIWTKAEVQRARLEVLLEILEIKFRKVCSSFALTLLCAHSSPYKHKIRLIRLNDPNKFSKRWCNYRNSSKNWKIVYGTRTTMAVKMVQLQMEKAARLRRRAMVIRRMLMVMVRMVLRVKLIHTLARKWLERGCNN